MEVDLPCNNFKPMQDDSHHCNNCGLPKNEHDEKMQITWVKCPICGEPNMRSEPEGSEGESIIHCVNLACGSNGGTNFSRVREDVISIPKMTAKDRKKTAKYEKEHLDFHKLWGEFQAGLTDKDWADWDKSAKIARENRVRCNKLTKAEREKYFAIGMRVIYGHKWTKKIPTNPGWYWVKSHSTPYGIYIGVEHFPCLGCNIDRRYEWYAGPLEEPL